jgi:hypothetical protein
MVAEKAADLIRCRPPLSAFNRIPASRHRG